MPIGQNLVVDHRRSLTHGLAVDLADTVGGTLAGITSRDENAFVAALADRHGFLFSDDSMWIGLTQ